MGVIPFSSLTTSNCILLLLCMSDTSFVIRTLVQFLTRVMDRSLPTPVGRANPGWVCGAMVARLTSIVVRHQKVAVSNTVTLSFFSPLVIWHGGAFSSETRLSLRHLHPPCSVTNNNNNRLVDCSDPRRKDRRLRARGYLARRLNNHLAVASSAPLRTHQPPRLARVCLGPLNSSHPRAFLDLPILGLKGREQAVACLDLRVIYSSNSSSSSNNNNSNNSNHNRARSLVAQQILRANRVLVGACSEALPLPSHQLAARLVPEHQPKAAVISSELPPQPRQPPGGCSEGGPVPPPEAVCLDRQHNLRPVWEGDYLDRNLVQTLNPLVPSLVRLRPSNPNRPSQVYSDNQRGDLEGLEGGF